ncbi:hypothetical protein L9G16_20575, partial [Shewanella sp. A25]|nr:hypothetical protein [Shewanella shenzhenensis]
AAWSSKLLTVLVTPLVMVVPGCVVEPVVAEPPAVAPACWPEPEEADPDEDPPHKGTLLAAWSSKLLTVRVTPLVMVVPGCVVDPVVAEPP